MTRAEILSTNMTDWLCSECGWTNVALPALLTHIRFKCPNAYQPTIMDRLEHMSESGPNECRLWTGYTRKGYGRLGIDGKLFQAHRVAYELANGPIPEGLELDHLCRNRACINPDHLEPVTGRENIMRGEAIPARNARKTECKNGHPFTVENTYLRPSGGNRECRTCKLAAGQQRRAS